jgi:hypothetical protein
MKEVNLINLGSFGKFMQEKHLILPVKKNLPFFVSISFFLSSKFSTSKVGFYNKIK